MADKSSPKGYAPLVQALEDATAGVAKAGRAESFRRVGLASGGGLGQSALRNAGASHHSMTR